MTDAQKQYIIANWKTKTPTQLAIELNTEKIVVRASDVLSFLRKNDITPITKRDLISKQVIRIYQDSESPQVASIARQLKVSQQLIKDIVQELGLAERRAKPKKTKIDPLDERELFKKKLAASLARMARSKEIKAARAGFTVYNQTGSPVLDELRGIKTTKRETTLLSNTIKNPAQDYAGPTL